MEDGWAAVSFRRCVHNHVLREGTQAMMMSEL